MDEKLRDHVLSFLFELVSEYEHEIYRNWTKYLLIPNTKRPFYKNLYALLETILYRPIRFSIRTGLNTIEFWDDRPTLSINANLFPEATRRAFLEKFLKPMMVQWQLFFKQHALNLQNREETYCQFLFNSTLEKYFQRHRVVHILLTKLLLLSVCYEDAGQTFHDVVRASLAVVVNLNLAHREDSAPGTLDFLDLLCDWLRQKNLYALVIKSAAAASAAIGLHK